MGLCCLIFQIQTLFLTKKCHMILHTQFSTQRKYSNSPALADFASRLVNFVLNLPKGQVKVFEEFKLHKNCVINLAHQNVLGAG